MQEYTEAIQAVLDKQIKDRRNVKGALVRVSPQRWHDCLILVFDDGSWAHYMADSDADGGGIVGFDGDRPDTEDLFLADLITAEQYDEYRIYREERREAEQRAHELATLARLQEKYGTGRAVPEGE